MAQGNIETTSSSPQKRNRLVRNLPILILVALLGGPAGLNYSGFCISKGRWLSDEERVHIVANYQNNRTIMPIYIKGIGYKNFKQIPYQSVDELLAKNPYCCKVVGSGDVPRPSMWDRIFGKNSNKIINVKYKVMHLNETGQQDSYEVNYYNTLSNCGESVH